MLYGLLILLLAGACYVAYIYLVRHYIHKQISPDCRVEATSCMVPIGVRLAGVLPVMLAFVGFVVLLIGVVK